MRKLKCILRGDQGFTLVELIVSIALIALVMMLFLTMFSSANNILLDSMNSTDDTLDASWLLDSQSSTDADGNQTLVARSDLGDKLSVTINGITLDIGGSYYAAKGTDGGENDGATYLVEFVPD